MVETVFGKSLVGDLHRFTRKNIITVCGKSLVGDLHRFTRNNVFILT
jgi:hypothetical protein